MTDTDNPVLRSFGEDALKAAIDQTDAQKALDDFNENMALALRYAENDSLTRLKTGTAITIQTALQRMITPPASPLEGGTCKDGLQVVDIESLKKPMFFISRAGGTRFVGYEDAIPDPATEGYNKCLDYLKSQGIKLVRE